MGSCETRGTELPGFTLVELLLVLGLLGLMAALLLPRFMERKVSPLDLTVRTVAGELEASAALYHAQWIAHGQPAVDTPLSEFGGLRANESGYPYGLGDNSRGQHGVTTAADCVAIFRLLLAQGGLAASDYRSPLSVSAVAVAEELLDSQTDFAAIAAAPGCRYYLTRDLNAESSTSQSAGELLVLEYDPDRGRVRLAREPASALSGES